MGCGIEHVRGRQFVYFTKNGQTVSSLIAIFRVLNIKITSQNAQRSINSVYKFNLTALSVTFVKEYILFC